MTDPTRDEMIIEECNKVAKKINEAKSLNTMPEDFEKTEATITKYGKGGKKYTLSLNQFKDK